MYISLLILWGTIGLVNLIMGNITRLSYGCVWAVLIALLIKGVIG